jgi:hypothetical protein
MENRHDWPPLWRSVPRGADGLAILADRNGRDAASLSEPASSTALCLHVFETLGPDVDNAKPQKSIGEAFKYPPT